MCLHRYNDEDALGEFQKKGGLKFLPKSWQGEIEGDYETVPIENAWYLFIIGTIKRTEEGLKTIYKMVMLATMITLLFLDLISGIWRRRWTAPYCLVRGGSRLLVLHGIVVFIAFMGMKTIDNSNWARDITTGKSYRLPELVSMVDENGRHPTLATLPTETDVLFVPHYASDYLAGYGRVIDFAHPGNAKWNGLTRQYAQGYLILSNELQRDFCESLLNYVHQDARFLKQGEEREWLPITETQELFDICHQDMVAASDKRIAAMVRQLKSLQMATKYGRFWNTVLQRNIIPLYLKQWQSILVPQRPWSPSMSMPTKLIQPLKRHFLQTISSTSMKNRRKSSIPKVGQPQEPFPLAWIREGDLVEAMYDCDSECKFSMLEKE